MKPGERHDGPDPKPAEPDEDPKRAEPDDPKPAEPDDPMTGYKGPSKSIRRKRLGGPKVVPFLVPFLSKFWPQKQSKKCSKICPKLNNFGVHCWINALLGFGAHQVTLGSLFGPPKAFLGGLCTPITLQKLLRL
jgi:hypothetical protein